MNIRTAYIEATPIFSTCDSRENAVSLPCEPWITPEPKRPVGCYRTRVTNENRSRILAVMTDKPKSIVQIAKAAGVNSRVATPHVNALALKGVVRKTITKHGPRFALMEAIA